MDAAELKVVCDNYEASLDLLRNKMRVVVEELYWARMDAASGPLTSAKNSTTSIR